MSTARAAVPPPLTATPGQPVGSVEPRPGDVAGSEWCAGSRDGSKARQEGRRIAVELVEDHCPG